MPLEGSKDKIAGKVREVKGRATGDAAEEMKGQAQQFRGEGEHKAARSKRQAEGKAEELKGKIKQHIP